MFEHIGLSNFPLSYLELLYQHNMIPNFLKLYSKRLTLSLHLYKPLEVYIKGLSLKYLYSQSIGTKLNLKLLAIKLSGNENQHIVCLSGYMEVEEKAEPSKYRRRKGLKKLFDGKDGEANVENNSENR